MKNILILLFGLIFLNSCRNDEDILIPIDLGKTSTSMSFQTTPSVINNRIIFSVNVTPGAKYSSQLSDIDGNVVKSQGITASNNTESISIDINNTKVGTYDLIFIDVQGNELKYPVIIKK